MLVRKAPVGSGVIGVWECELDDRIFPRYLISFILFLFGWLFLHGTIILRVWFVSVFKISYLLQFSSHRFFVVISSLCLSWSHGIPISGFLSYLNILGSSGNLERFHYHHHTSLVPGTEFLGWFTIH